MEIFKKITTFKTTCIIFGFLFCTILILTILYINNILQEAKWSTIIAGLITGFIVALFQTALSWYEIIKIDEYNSLKITKILSHRKDADYYGDLISKSKSEIKVLGVTAQRFLEDFGNDKPRALDHENVLILALQRGVKVKILVADNNFLDDEENRYKANQAQKRLTNLSRKYESNFEYCYYKHPPTHSVVIIDEECIVGPILPKVESRYTPAIHLRTNSTFAAPYIDYFNQEWEQWRENK